MKHRSIWPCSYFASTVHSVQCTVSPQKRIFQQNKFSLLIRGPGGFFRGPGGLIRGPGGLIRGPGGLIRGPGGLLIRGPGGLIRGPGGFDS